MRGEHLRGAHAIWALYQFIVDPEAETCEIVPLRAPNLHLNALKFLEPGGKYGLVQLASGLEWSAGMTILDIDIRIVHPFPLAPQFSGFDVKGILISKATRTGFSDPDLVLADTYETRLLNPDGYTRWWNPREFPGDTIFAYRDGALGMKDSVWNFESTLNGFKYFCDSLAPRTPVEDLDQADRGVFRAGASNIRHYTISLLGGLVFNYAIDASWERPEHKPPDVPDDFPPSANQPEPWRLVATDAANTLYYETADIQGGHLVLNIGVYDWQSPLPTSALGTVVRVVGEWPGLFPPTEADYISDEGDYALWRLELTPAPGALPSTDDVEYIIWAESVDGAGYGGILDPAEPLIAANRFLATVLSEKPNTPPEVTDGVTGNASPGLVVEDYSVTVYDPDPDTIAYLWSLEPLGDPYNFDDPGNGDGTLTVDWADHGFGEYTIQCQVSDGVNAPVEAAPLDVSCGNTPPELGDIEGLVDVAAEDTAVQYTVSVYDPDFGQDLTFIWSFVPDGDPEDFSIPGDAGDGSLTIDYSLVPPALYDLNVQVSDGFTPVTGNHIDITHNNTPPTVEEVTGNTPVTSLDTDELYEAAWSDPDATQTLSFLWSVVPEGDPEDFTLGANPDGTININWSTYAVGNWDLNLQADDGMDQSTGTKLTVVKENTPPTVGDVEGPDMVTSDHTAAMYSAPIADIDPDQTLIVLWSVVPTGEAPNYVIPAEPDDSVIIDWSMYADGYYDVNVQADDSYAQVEGTLLTVQKVDNLPPYVGAVSGPTPVYHSDTYTEYNAPISDPDGDMLTVFWSVVAHGDPPDYSIPGDETNPLVIDWSTYPDLGDYDINVQADDGLNPPVEGTLLVVSLLNTPPEITDCNGPTAVDSTYTAAHYTVTYSDIDPGQPLVVNWSVVPDGDPPDYSLPANPDGSLDFDWSTVDVGNWDVAVRVYDGYADDTCGPIDVVKSNLPPNVGAVTGPTPVDAYDTDANYTAPISDPDTTQTLTIMWSAVLDGAPRQYILPANPDGSVDVDWSILTVNNYEVCVRADDGYVQVEGTPLIVQRINTPPEVGAVGGPNPVTCIDNAAVYSAPHAELDPGQTLTIVWSVVPSGDTPEYLIPANPDGSLTIDWGSFENGDWDVNIRCDDGFVQVEGTLLTVTRENYPPDVGAVTGPTPVNDNDVEIYSLNPPTYDCDLFQTISHWYSIRPQGSTPDYSIFSPTGEITVDWYDYGPGVWTIACSVNDGIHYVEATPLDVVVTLHPCEGTAHTYFGELNPNPYSTLSFSVLPRADIAFVESGFGMIEGHGLAQIGPSTLGVFDADSPGSSSVMFQYFLGKFDAVMSLDSDPIDGRVLTVTATDPDQVKIIDSSIIMGSPIIGVIDSGDPLITWVAIDIEGDGDFWAVQRDGTGDVAYRLVRYTFLADDPYYEYDPTGTRDITGKVGTNTDIFDIAINWEAEMLYLLEAGPVSQGTMQTYHVVDGFQAQFMGTLGHEVFSQPLDYDEGGWTGWAGFADIDIDHADAADERCRILLYGRLADQSGELIRMDADTYLIFDRQFYLQAWPAFAINPDLDPAIRNLIMPDEDSCEYFDTPLNW